MPGPKPCSARRPRSPLLRPPRSANMAPGMYSDDCEMTVGLMKALRAEGAAGLDAEGMLSAWVEEWELAKTRSVARFREQP